VQDDSYLLVGGDLARRQRGAVRQHFKVAGKVCFPEWDVDIVTALCGIQLSHWLNHTASQEGIAEGGLLNDVRRENLRDDDIRAKSRHDEFLKEWVYGVGAARYTSAAGCVYLSG
jgi:hypothetical protein